MNKRSTFVLNRLDKICLLCDRFPIKFKFDAGFENPADYITRPISHRCLMKSVYFTGPDFLKFNQEGLSMEDILQVNIPESGSLQGCGKFVLSLSRSIAAGLSDHEDYSVYQKYLEDVQLILD